MVEQKESILFALKSISVTPESPRLNEPITISGKIDLFRIPFIGPLWVLATITYPESWWEKIIPIIGAPHVRETTIAIGGDFSIALPAGFDRDGEYLLQLRVYPGPTAALDSIVIPPAPAIASFDTKFTVAGELPEEAKVGTPSGLTITAYDSTSPPDVLQVKPGATIKVVSEFDYVGPATSGKFYTALWHPSLLDPHDQIAYGEQAFTIAATSGTHVKGTVSITVPAGFTGTNFGLYTKLSGAIKDVISPFYENIIDIVGPVVVPAPTAFKITSPITKVTVNPGETVPVTVEFSYVGPAWRETLYAVMYTGVENEISGSANAVAIVVPAATVATKMTTGITIPVPNRPGETFGILAKLGNVAKAKIPSVVEIVTPTPTGFTLEVKADPIYGGMVTRSPAKDYYERAEPVTLTAYVFGLYHCSHWTNRDNVIIGRDSFTIIVPVLRDEVITAHFTLEAAPPVQEPVTYFKITSPITKVTVNPGETVRVGIGFTYVGPVWRETLYAVMYTGVENEISGSANAVALVVPEAKVATPMTTGITIPVPNRPGETFGILAKLGNVAKAKIPSVVEIVTPTPIIGYTLTVSQSPAVGTVNINPKKAAYDRLDVVILTAYPVAGYTFDYWLINGSKRSYNPYSVVMIQDSTAIVYYKKV